MMPVPRLVSSSATPSPLHPQQHHAIYPSTIARHRPRNLHPTPECVVRPSCPHERPRHCTPPANTAISRPQPSRHVKLIEPGCDETYRCSSCQAQAAATGTAISIHPSVHYRRSQRRVCRSA
ncbi:uncharacterized protein K452DRAFT_10151 [Aplosporella prunicola CBS 121167]|uniref:Uncharacterized protein n=1 Tax=Aplosporella prunicola CBS 121167 TaxID=1176127 RepID=A0A6A6BGL7_9PEZI|nr:uncharacterized protein K452DRAFT_10151 [Aplosporella prunicola CBS 121167]KAF2142738.1 hypothetical protein K452DRAFT_10151 [Aplosporella prunicola CBS 121167]